MFYPVIVIVISLLSAEMISETSPPRNDSQGGIKNHFERYLAYKRYTNKNEKWNKQIKSSHSRFFRNLEWFHKSLNTSIGRYDKIEEQENLFHPADKVCEIYKCGNLTSAPTSEEKIRKIVKTDKKFKRKSKCLKYLEKRISNSLSNFQRDARYYEEEFQWLINFEELFHFKEKDTTNGNRSAVLKQLQSELRNLQVEVQESLGIDPGTEGRGNHRKSENLSEPDSQLDLIIGEWRLLSYSKEYLEDYIKNLNKVIERWRKIKKIPEKRKHLTTTYNC